MNFNHIQESDFSEEKVRCFTALGYSNRHHLLDRTLELVLNSSWLRTQDGVAVIASIANNRYGESLAWTFVQKKYEYLFEFEFSVYLSLLVGLRCTFDTEELSFLIH